MVIEDDGKNADPDRSSACIDAAETTVDLGKHKEGRGENKVIVSRRTRRRKHNWVHRQAASASKKTTNAQDPNRGRPRYFCQF